MKKNLYYLSLLLGLVFGMTMFTACGGDDDDNTASSSNNGSASGSDAGGIVPGKFMGPKRVFGDNLLSSFGRENGTCYELTYNSDGFVTKVKRVRYNTYGSDDYYEYEVAYSDNQVIVTIFRNGVKGNTGTFTIGSNGYAKTLTGYFTKEDVTYEYDSEGHLTKLTTTSPNEIFIGTLTWQDGNIIKQNDNDGSAGKAGRTMTYTSINNVAGLYIIRAAMGADFDEFYDEIFYYMGLLGKGPANLVQSYSSNGSSSTTTGENSWTLDDAGRPTKCVTTETRTQTGSGSSSTTSTYFWTYR